MKKPITIIALLAGTASVHAQGTIQFSDYVQGFTIDVWSPGPPGFEQIGNTATDSPAGSTVYGGIPLGGSATGSGSTGYGNGNDYTIGLYASTSSSIPVTLGTTNLAATSQFQTTGGTGSANVIKSPAFGGGGNAGSWFNKQVSLPGTATGTAGSAQVELAAWYNGGGTYTSYTAALAAGAPDGSSEIGTINGLGGYNGTSSPSSTAPTLAGLGITSFSLVGGSFVPEPNTIALGVIGAYALLMRLRRKQ